MKTLFKSNFENDIEDHFFKNPTKFKYIKKIYEFAKIENKI